MQNISTPIVSQWWT